MATKCAFIISPSYSGSTLLSMLLAHHPGLVTLGEFLDNRERRHRDGEGNFCSCGQELTVCPYLSELTRKLQAKGMDFSVDFPDTAFNSADDFTDRVLRAHVRAPWFEFVRRMAIALLPQVRGTIKHVVERNSLLLATLLEQEGADVYLDSAKNNNRVLFFDRYAPDIDVKVIWLIRDGRGVVSSIMRHYGKDLKAAVEYWVHEQTIVARAAEMIPTDQLLTMHYEDLCNDPATWLNRSCEFLGLDPARLPETYGDKELHLTGNNMRLKGIGEIRLDEKWKAKFSEADLDIFASIGGPLNKQLGYE